MANDLFINTCRVKVKIDAIIQFVNSKDISFILHWQFDHTHYHLFIH